MNIAHGLAPLRALFLLALATAAQAAPRSVIDDTGTSFTLPENPCRIVSLAPGTTAMLYAAGAGQCLVGTIAHSKEPAEAAQIPVVGDAETLDFERLLTLRPALVVVAVDVVQRARIDRIRALGIPVYQVHVTRLAQMADSLQRLGELTGTSAIAGPKAAELRARLGQLQSRYRERAPLRVLYQIWDQPIYTIGGRHVISDALEICGATNIFADLSTAAPAVTREAALLRDPDVILVSAPPASADAWIAEWRKFPALRAAATGRILPYLDERMDRMGPSVIDAAEALCKLLDGVRAPLPGR